MMAVQQTYQRDERAVKRTRKGGRAFIIEAIALFSFLVITLVVTSLLFLASANRAQESLELERAVILASNTAERFSANLFAGDLETSQDGLTASCEITPQTMPGGTLYKATITVTGDSGTIYSIETARYVSEVS